MQLPSELTVTAIRQALANGQRVLLAGGPAGSYHQKIQRDDRFVHLISSETGHKIDHNYTIPTNVGVVLLSRFMAARLMANLNEQCKVRRIPHFGMFRSTGSIERAVELALAFPATTHNHTALVVDEEQEAAARLAQVDQQVLGGRGYTTHPPAHAAVAPQPTPAPFKEPAPPAKPTPPVVEAVAPQRIVPNDHSLPTVNEIKQFFADARAALDLAEEQAIKVLTAQAESLKAVEKLAALRELLK